MIILTMQVRLLPTDNTDGLYLKTELKRGKRAVMSRSIIIITITAIIVIIIAIIVIIIIILAAFIIIQTHSASEQHQHDEN